VRIVLGRLRADRELQRSATLGLLGIRVGRNTRDRKNERETARKSKYR
jgi:hypothetical protein